MKILFRIITSLLLCLYISTGFQHIAYADEKSDAKAEEKKEKEEAEDEELKEKTNENVEWFTYGDEKELKKMLKIEFDDISNPIGWVTNIQSAIAANVDKNDRHETWFWNAPNLQAAVTNDINSQIHKSGYGIIIGQDVSEDDRYFKMPKRDKAKTAAQMYGYKIPNPTYVGEKPFVTINIGGVIIPESTTGKVGKFFKSIYNGNVDNIKDYKNEMGTLTYLAPRDYSKTNQSFEDWIKVNWGRINDKNSKNYIKDSQVINIEATGEEGGKATGKISGDDKVWVAANIIRTSDFNGIDWQTDHGARKIYNLIESSTKDQFPNVAAGIVASSGIVNNIKIDRQMPYDLSTMTDKDKDLFGGISDPRTEQQLHVFNSWTTYLSNLMNTLPLVISGTLAKLTVAFERMGTFSFMESLGVKPTLFWDNVLIRMSVDVMGILVICKCISVGFQLYKSRQSMLFKVMKLFGQIMIVLAIVALMTNPKQTYDYFKDFSSKVMNISSTTLEANSKLKPLYGTAKKQRDKNEVELWLPYFNMWTKYQTGYSLLDKQQKISIDKNNPKNEEKGLVKPSIDGVSQPYWSTILASNFTTPGSESYNNIYRVVDHYMAPRIDAKVDTDKGKINIRSVKANENYNGGIQKKIDYPTLFTQFIIFLAVAFKNIIFFEMFFNLCMLIYELAMVANNGRKLGIVFKRVFANLVDIMVVNVIVMVLVYTSLVTSGIPLLLIMFIFSYALFHGLVKLAMSNSVFKPRTLEAIMSMNRKFMELFEDKDGLREKTYNELETINSGVKYEKQSQRERAFRDKYDI